MASRPPWWLRAPARRLRSGVYRLLWAPLVRRYARPFHVVGLQHLKGLPGPVIFAAHHESHSDTPLVLAALPSRFRERLVIAAAADVLFANPVSGALATLFAAAVAVDRRGPAIASLRGLADLVSGGHSLLVYPQGHCSPDGTVGEFRPGVGLLARLTRAPVVLVGINGSRNVLPLARRWPSRAPVTVSFDAPRFYAHASAEAFAAELQGAMQRMLTGSHGE